MPIREKLTQTMGHGNKHSCFQCILEGEWLKEARTVRKVPPLSCHFMYSATLAPLVQSHT